MIITNYDIDRHGLFLPGTATRNSGFFKSEYDFSCVGFAGTVESKSWLCAAINPMHAINANHVNLNGSTLNFVGMSGTIHQRTVASRAQIGGNDWAINTLGEALPSSDFTFPRIPRLPGGLWAENWRGAFIKSRVFIGVGRSSGEIVAGLGAASLNQTSTVSGAFTTFCIVSQSITSPVPDEWGVEGGDSGSPCFMQYGNELLYLGPISANGANASARFSWMVASFREFPDAPSANENNIDGLRQAVQAGGQEFRFRFVDMGSKVPAVSRGSAPPAVARNSGLPSVTRRIGSATAVKA